MYILFSFTILVRLIRWSRVPPRRLLPVVAPYRIILRIISKLNRILTLNNMQRKRVLKVVFMFIPPNTYSPRYFFFYSPRLMMLNRSEEDAAPMYWTQSEKFISWLCKDFFCILWIKLQFCNIPFKADILCLYIQL